MAISTIDIGIDEVAISLISSVDEAWLSTTDIGIDEVQLFPTDIGFDEVTLYNWYWYW